MPCHGTPFHTVPSIYTHHQTEPPFFSRRRVAALPQLAAYKIGCDPIIYAGICSIRWPLFWDGFGGLGRHRCKKGRERERVAKGVEFGRKIQIVPNSASNDDCRYLGKMGVLVLV